MKILKQHKTFEGVTQFWSHPSVETKTEMKFSTFLPNGEVKGCIVWLSGLTCTDENFISKAGVQKYLAKEQLMVICPDTSPRGLNLPSEHDSYDFGSGAGFYVDAVTSDYATNYRMESYVTKELHQIILEQFKVKNVSIMGHSMGGHGALVLGLKNPDQYKSISAFSPIVNPMASAWGLKAFKGYLGEDQNLWKKYDSCELIKSGHKHNSKILIHQGTRDEFLEKELLPQHFVEAAKVAHQDTEVKMCEGYDHSYYFISTFIEEHVQHHARYLRGV